MELRNVKAKFNLKLKLILKNNIVKKAKLSNMDVDDVLDAYIDNSENLSAIHHLIETNLDSNVDIDSICFVEDETLVDSYDDENLYITSDCEVNAEEYFSYSKDWDYIEESLSDTNFWFNEENIFIEEMCIDSLM